MPENLAPISVAADVPTKKYVDDAVAASGGTEIFNGSGPPAKTLGEEGDYYVDTTGKVLYGPKENVIVSGAIVNGPFPQIDLERADGAYNLGYGFRVNQADTSFRGWRIKVKDTETHLTDWIVRLYNATTQAMLAKRTVTVVPGYNEFDWTGASIPLAQGTIYLVSVQNPPLGTFTQGISSADATSPEGAVTMIAGSGTYGNANDTMPINVWGNITATVVPRIGVESYLEGQWSVAVGGGLTQADADTRYINVSGDTMSGALVVPAPVAGGDATNKTYVDTGLTGKANTSHSHALGDLPSTLATDAEVAAAITAHEGAANPHPNYLLPAEILAGTNVTVDRTTTPGSVIINGAAGGGGGISQADADTRYVNATGDTMTGDLTAPLIHATGGRIEISVAAWPGPLGVYLDTAGGELDIRDSNDSSLTQVGVAHPLYPNSAATKQYVDTGLAGKANVSALPAPGGAPVNTNAAAASAGSAATFSRSDHKHQISVANPVALGSAIAAGSSDSLARADHVHPFPTAANVGADPAGTAASAVSTHAAAADPHPNYLLPTEVIAGTNITVDRSTTPGSVIINGAAGGGGGISQADADTRYVNVSGDTMTGNLTAPRIHATNNRLEVTSGGVGGYFEIWGGELQARQSSDGSPAPINVGQPTNASGATPKFLVDNLIANRAIIHIGTKPNTPAAGTIWVQAG